MRGRDLLVIVWVDAGIAELRQEGLQWLNMT
jgi:hypothetical protein